MQKNRQDQPGGNLQNRRREDFDGAGDLRDKTAKESVYSVQWPRLFVTINCSFPEGTRNAGCHEETYFSNGGEVKNLLNLAGTNF
jgi:hypothetical protein